MSSSHPSNKAHANEEEQDTFLDPNETFEEYAEDNASGDHPMDSSDDEADDMIEDEEVIVDDSIQGFFLHTSPIYSVALYDNWAATGGGDDLGYVWDVTNGEMIMPDVDLLSRRVRRGGRPVQLSSTEFELLVYLMRHHGQVVSREEILSSVWGYEHDPATNVVDVYVGYLPPQARPGRRSGADLHDPRGRLPAGRRQLSAMRSARAAVVPVGLRWRLAGWVALVTVLCTGIAFVAVYSGTGTQLRHQIDREMAGDASEFADNLQAAGARSSAQLSAAATRYVRNQPFSASSTLLFALIPRARGPRATARSCSRPPLFRTTARRPPSRHRRIACRHTC